MEPYTSGATDRKCVILLLDLCSEKRLPLNHGLRAGLKEASHKCVPLTYPCIYVMGHTLGGINTHPCWINP